MEHMSQSAFEFLASGTSDIFLEMAGSLAFGVAAVWLLAPQLARSHRLLTFLCFAPTLAGFSLFTFLVKQDWSEDDTAVALGMLVPLAISVFVVAAAITFGRAGLPGPLSSLGFYLWLLLSLLVLWLVIAAPFFGFAMIISGGRLPWSEFFTRDSDHDDRQLRHAAAVFDPVFGQPVFPRTAQEVAAIKPEGPAGYLTVSEAIIRV